MGDVMTGLFDGLDVSNGVFGDVNLAASAMRFFFESQSQAKTQNLYYEGIAVELNQSRFIGYDSTNIDVLKHTIAAMDNAKSGPFLTYSTGVENELYAAFRGRDGYNEHFKDLTNNTIGIVAESWFEDNFGHAPSLHELSAVVELLAKSNMLANYVGPIDKGQVGIDQALLATLGSGLAAPFVKYDIETFLDNNIGRLDELIQIVRCFPAHTRIQTSRTTSTAISALRVGDVVLAFDARADKGRGALVPRRVTQAYRNTTTDWIRLRWARGTAREGGTTPGPHFLDEFGGARTLRSFCKQTSGALWRKVDAPHLTHCPQDAEAGRTWSTPAGRARLARYRARLRQRVHLWVSPKKFQFGLMSSSKCTGATSPLFHALHSPRRLCIHRAPPPP